MRKKLFALLLALGCLLSSIIFTACDNILDSNSSEESIEIETKGLEYSLSKNKEYYILTSIGNSKEENIVIPEKHNDLPVKEIGGNSFETSSYCKRVVIGKNVTVIGNGAFYGCGYLKEVVILGKITSIGVDAFYGTSVRDVYISDVAAWCKIDYKSRFSYPSISSGIRLYLNNQELENLIIPDSVTEIKEYAFMGCVSLKRVTIPDGVTEIGDSAFVGCGSLTSITVDENNPNYASQDGILYNKEKTEIIHIPLAISGAVNIPNSITSIESNAFSGCGSLTNVTIGSSVASIGWEAFCGCSSLTTVTFEELDGWTVIGNASVTEISATELADGLTAAEYLTGTYCYDVWTRSEE